MITATQSRIIRQTAEGSFWQTLYEGKPALDVARFCGVENTNKVQIDLGFAGAVPLPTVFTGARQHKAVKLYTQSITPKAWEATVDIQGQTLDDDQTGSLARVGSKMAARCQEFYAYRWTQVLVAGTGTTIGTNPLSGLALFSDSHAHSGSNQDNNFTSAAATGTQPTAAELLSAVDAAFQVVLAYTDDQGVAMGGNASDWAIVVPPAYASVANVVLGANGTMGGSGMGAYDLTSLANGFRGTCEIVVNPYLTATDRLYGVRKTGTPCTLLVQREPWRFEMRDRSNSDIGFEQEVITFGAFSRFDFGYGDPLAAFIHVFT